MTDEEAVILALKAFSKPKLRDPKRALSAAGCRLCNDIVISRYRHDFTKCRCGEIFLDGGDDYQRAGAMDFYNLINLEVYPGDPLDLLEKENRKAAEEKYFQEKLDKSKKHGIM